MVRIRLFQLYRRVKDNLEYKEYKLCLIMI